MQYLIVNADDFGYSFSVNEGIIKAHTEGVVTSTSVIVDAIGAQEAAGLRAYPELSVGLHFAVTGFNNVLPELLRQVERFVAITGVRPDHIDTHKIHTTEPRLKDILLAYSAEHSIPVRGLGDVRFIDSYMGLHTGGDVSVARFMQAVDQATAPRNEIMCHVGYSDDYLREHSSYSDMREQELKVLCDPAVRQYIRERGLALCNWQQIFSK